MIEISRQQFWKLYNEIGDDGYNYSGSLNIMFRRYGVVFNENQTWVKRDDCGVGVSEQVISYIVSGPEENINKIMMLL